MSAWVRACAGNPYESGPLPSRVKVTLIDVKRLGYTRPPDPEGTVLDGPMFSSGLAIGQRIFIVHPEIDEPVAAIVTGQVPQTDYVSVRIEATGDITLVPLGLIREASRRPRTALIRDDVIPAKLYHGTYPDKLESIRQEGLRCPPGVNPYTWYMLTTSRGQAARYGMGLVIEYSNLPDEYLGLPADHGVYGFDAQVYGVVVPIPGSYISNVYYEGPTASKSASSWRGFVKDDEPFWKWADIVIASERTGRGRYFEVYVHGEAWRNFPRLDDAKSALIAEFGTLEFTPHRMEKVTVDHYYYGPMDDFTTPLTIYLADL